MGRILRQPLAALADICDGFFPDLAFVDSCVRLESDALPQPARRLLVHRDHMTVVLREHAGTELDLSVLQQECDAEEYAREILLTTREPSPRVVEFGIVRMRLLDIPPAARAEIVDARTPLGDILIRHNVMRRISPRWYFRFPADTSISRTFGNFETPTYGRLGTIFCNEEPAIDVLEVVGG